jgi:TolA-binding protein
VANRARRQGDTASAEAAYDALWSKFRASPEAVASRAIAGQWMLDRGMLRAAIALFRQYLAAAVRGELEEDVLVGLADAHESNGDRAAAVAIWARLLAEHPRSVHAERAREGLRRLQAGSAR